MRRPDDYSDEMRSSSDEIQVAERLRAALVKPPAPEVEAAHLASMAAAVSRVAAASELEERGHDMRSFAKKRTLVLAAAATLALGAGLAAAVTLPDQASDRAKEVQAAKVATTNGEDGPSVQSSAHGQAVSDLARDDSTRGCEHGRAVSDLASSKAADNRNSDGPGHDPCEEKEQDAGRATGKAWGHGEPPGRKLGHAKQSGGAGGSSHIKSGGTAGSQGIGHGIDGSPGSKGKSKGSTAVDSDAEGATSEPSPAPSPAPEPSATPTTEPSPA